MTFLTPLAFVLLALIPPIIALYLLKLRRQEHLVSSTYLWRRFVRDVEANAPWQKLRRNLLLLLQILLLLCLIFALTRPATPTEGIAGQTLVLILDTSASMAAMDVELTGLTTPTRLDAAKAAAGNLVTNLPDDARVTLLAAAGGEVQTLVSASQDRRQVLTALDSLQPTARNSDLVAALTLAEAIVARESAAEIVLFSDGVIQLPAQGSFPVRFVPLGRSAANQAISALAVTPAASGAAILFVQVSNYNNQPVQRRLILEVDGAVFNAIDLDIPAQGHVEQTFTTLPATAQSLLASLAPAETDFLPLDDQAWAVLHPGQLTPTTLVTNGNFFLQTALNLLPQGRFATQLQLTIVSPNDWQNNPSIEPSNPPTLQPSNPPSSSSLTIFDSSLPDQLPPGNLLIIAPPQSIPSLFDVLGQVTNPVISPVTAEVALLQGVNLAQTQILTSAVISATGWSQAVITGEATGTTGRPPPSIPLLLAGEHDGRRIVILPFALQQSDLPLRPAFPILLANVLNYLAPGSGALLPAEVAPGEAPALTVPGGVSQARLVNPAGEETVITAEAGQVKLPRFSQPGLYHLSFEPAQTLAPATLAVNFFDSRESAIAPVSKLNFEASAAVQTTSAPLPPAYQEWWRPVAMGALILLGLEWLVYYRDKVFRYWQLLRWGLLTTKI